MKKQLLLTSMLALSAVAFAATIVGPAQVCVGSTAVYHAQRGSGESNYQFSVTGGTIISQGTTSQGDPSITVRWPSSPTSATIRLTYYTWAYPSFTSMSVTVDACYSEALSFDGIDDQVEVPDPNGRLNLGTGPFTFEVYFKLTASHDRSTMLSKRTIANGNDSDGFIFGFFGGSPYVQVGGTVNIQPAVGSINLFDGNCHHVAVRRNGTTISFFVDGLFLSNGNFTSSENINSPGPLWIGWDNAYTSPFPGWIGEVRIWNIARTNAQIQSSLGSNLTPQAGLVAYYDMQNSINSQSLSDLSGHGNNGILGNSSSVESIDPIWLNANQVCRVAGNFRLKGIEINEPIEDDSTADVVHYIPKVYPNPAQNQITVEFQEASNIRKPISIYDMMGNEVMKSWLDPGEQKKVISTESLHTGIYLLRTGPFPYAIAQKILILKQ